MLTRLRKNYGFVDCALCHGEGTRHFREYNGVDTDHWTEECWPCYIRCLHEHNLGIGIKDNQHYIIFEYLEQGLHAGKFQQFDTINAGTCRLWRAGQLEQLGNWIFSEDPTDENLTDSEKGDIIGEVAKEEDGSAWERAIERLALVHNGRV